jgi:hypothetical protein
MNKKRSITAGPLLIAEQEEPDIFIRSIYAATQPVRVQLKRY